jgi:hypothetical protein
VRKLEMLLEFCNRVLTVFLKIGYFPIQYWIFSLFLDSKAANCFYIQLNAQRLADGNGKPAEGFAPSFVADLECTAATNAPQRTTADSPKFVFSR